MSGEINNYLLVVIKKYLGYLSFGIYSVFYITMINETGDKLVVLGLILQRSY